MVGALEGSIWLIESVTDLASTSKPVLGCVQAYSIRLIIEKLISLDSDKGRFYYLFSLFLNVSHNQKLYSCLVCYVLGGFLNYLYSLLDQSKANRAFPKSLRLLQTLMYTLYL